MIQLAN